MARRRIDLLRPLVRVDCHLHAMRHSQEIHGLAERAYRCDRCRLAIDRDRNAAANLAAWAERYHVQAPDRQAGGRVNNALGGEGAGHRSADGETGPGELGTKAQVT